MARLTIVLVAVVRGLFTDARAQAPSGTIASVSASVVALRFFEGAFQPPPDPQRHCTVRPGAGSR
jgi:hypothetical protein